MSISMHRCFTPAVVLLLAGAPSAGLAVGMTLEQAIAHARDHTARGSIIRGDVQVAEQNYRAKRINFIVPSVSINGNIPSYNVDESYKFFGGSTRKRLYRTSGLDWVSFIQLKQNLLTGGSLSMSANLAATAERYPDTDPQAAPKAFLDETGRRGYFDFRFEQPILKAAAPKNDLDNRRDDRDLARLRRFDAEAALTRDVTDAYIGLLQAREKTTYMNEKFEASRLRAQIDSVKYLDGVLTEEGWLQSASAKLDAELAARDAAAVKADRERALALLLDLDVSSPIELTEPEPIGHPDDPTRVAYVADWERTVEIRKAAATFSKAKRAADYAAAGHGLTGDLKAGYSTGQGTVRLEGRPDENIDTRGWNVSLNLSYPVWDGGASSAAVDAARFEAERAQLELQQAKQAAQAEIVKLVNQVDVSFRRLKILRKQVDLAANRLSIAQERMDDGRLSEIGHLEAQAALSEARSKYLDELRSYLMNRASLDGKFAGAD